MVARTSTPDGCTLRRRQQGQTDKNLASGQCGAAARQHGQGGRATPLSIGSSSWLARWCARGACRVVSKGRSPRCQRPRARRDKGRNTSWFDVVNGRIVNDEGWGGIKQRRGADAYRRETVRFQCSAGRGAHITTGLSNRRPPRQGHTPSSPPSTANRDGRPMTLSTSGGASDEN